MLKPFLIPCLLWLATSLPATAQSVFDTRAEAAFVLDLTTNTVLMNKNGDTPLPPASMSKLMTLFMLFEALRDNPNITLDTRFGVSTRAREMGGSTMFLNERDRPTAEELIKGIIVQSGNDATVVVAEGLAGNERHFAQLMTERARELGMENTTLANASGWPDPNHRMSMGDLAILAQHLIEDFPQFYGYFAMPEWEFDGRAPQNRFNRNPLLTLGIGADGLKTGHTQEAGYGLVGSAKQGDRRIVFAISGLQSSSARAEEAERVVTWAFRQFVEQKIATSGELIADAPVWMGESTRVGLVAPADLSVLVEAVSRDDVVTELVYNTPLQAPIAQGDAVAELVVTREGLPEARLPLVADRDVSYGGFVPRLRSAGMTLINRITQQAGALF
ncbi:D-alanyl-D-alanine carboxypeptidase [Rhodobacteraceae bacterium SC52]|nr:D-alanyl-D-alanine carboxypeptidase [Rhodobacteraceae bacterium SC52]